MNRHKRYIEPTSSGVAGNHQNAICQGIFLSNIPYN
jgi:hypothetical protein